jgi:hypothetical protein
MIREVPSSARGRAPERARGVGRVKPGTWGEGGVAEFFPECITPSSV